MLYTRFPAQQKTNLTADVVIIGTSPYALAVATALAKQNRHILVVEAGSEKVHAAWSDGSFGPFSSEDFQQPGWHVSEDKLSKFYPAVDRFCLNGAKKILSKPLAQNLFIGSKSLRPVSENLSLPRFSLSERWKKWAQQTHCDVILGSLALDLFPSKLDPTKRTLRMQAGEKILAVEARYYVCAGNGLENVRLLLHSGFRSPALGAYLIEQPCFFSQDVLLFGASRFSRLNQWSTTAEFQKREQVRSANFKFISPDDLSALTAASDGLLRSNQYLRIPALCYNSEETRGVILQSRFAQIPRATNRVRLHQSLKDRLGRPELETEWRMSDEDWQNVEKSHAIFNSELITTNSGRYRKRRQISRIEDLLQDMRPSPVSMGTTRMARSSEKGVVDLNLKSYDSPSVYVVGPSVLPVSGSVPPTYTALAFAFRLAKHLNQELGG